MGSNSKYYQSSEFYQEAIGFRSGARVNKLRNSVIKALRQGQFSDKDEEAIVEFVQTRNTRLLQKKIKRFLREETYQEAYRIALKERRIDESSPQQILSFLRRTRQDNIKEEHRQFQPQKVAAFLFRSLESNEQKILGMNLERSGAKEIIRDENLKMAIYEVPITFPGKKARKVVDREFRRIKTSLWYAISSISHPEYEKYLYDYLRNTGYSDSRCIEFIQELKEFCHEIEHELQSDRYTDQEIKNIFKSLYQGCGLNTARTREANHPKEDLWKIHHVIPRSLGGSNSDLVLIRNRSEQLIHKIIDEQVNVIKYEARRDGVPFNDNGPTNTVAKVLVPVPLGRVSSCHPVSLERDLRSLYQQARKVIELRQHPKILDSFEDLTADINWQEKH